MTARQYMIESICRQAGLCEAFGGNMKRIISILLLLIFVCTMITSCSKLGSRQYVLDVLDAMDKGDDERFYKLLEDKSYDINRNPNLLIDRIVFFFPCVDNPLEKACRLERYDYVEALIDRGANLNKTCTFGALILAVDYMGSESGEKNAVAIVELLLKNGADPDGARTETYTALENAVIKWKYKNSYQICKLLIEHGADKSFRDEHFANRNAYEVAVESGAPQEFLDLLKPDK